MHLFSDTDTVATDVSWLRETGRKDKSKVLKYSRRAAARPKAVSPHTSCTSFHSNLTPFHLFQCVPCSIIDVVSADASSHLDTSSKNPVKLRAKPKKVNLFFYGDFNTNILGLGVYVGIDRHAMPHLVTRCRCCAIYRVPVQDNQRNPTGNMPGGPEELQRSAPRATRSWTLTAACQN